MHVEQLGKDAIKVGGVEVYLVHDQAKLNCNTEDHAKAIVSHNRSVGVIKVNTIDLGETVCNESGLIPDDLTKVVSLNVEYPSRTNDIGGQRGIDYGLSTIICMGLELIVDCLFPFGLIR